MSGDARPPVDAFTAAFGVPGSVILNSSSIPVDVTVIWHAERPSVGGFPFQGVAGAGADLRRYLAIPKADMPGVDLAAEIGSTIEVPEVADGLSAGWRLDRVDGRDAEFYECVVSR